MADTATLSDPRRRNVMWLAIVALVLVALAVFALWRQSAEVAPKYHAHPLFPDLAHHAREVARIHIESKTGKIDVVFLPMKGWVVTSHNDFPASFEEVNKTVIGVASLELIEEKTARKDWLHFLGLDTPPKGDGTLITLADDKGHVLASVVTGKSEDIGESEGGSGLYVREPDSTQSYLARSVFEPKTSTDDWYDKNLLGIDRERIQSTDVRPIGSPAYTVSRDKPTQADFKLTDMPAGRELAYPGSADGVGAAIVGLTFDDVKPAKDFDFTNAWRVVTHTFDGLDVTLDIIQQGQDYWATVFANSGPGKPAAGKEARAIDAKTLGWAYKLPSYKGQQLMTKLDSLLKAPGSPPAPAAPPAPATPAPKK